MKTSSAFIDACHHSNSIGWIGDSTHNSHIDEPYQHQSFSHFRKFQTCHQRSHRRFVFLMDTLTLICSISQAVTNDEMMEVKSMKMGGRSILYFVCPRYAQIRGLKEWQLQP